MFCWSSFQRFRVLKNKHRLSTRDPRQARDVRSGLLPIVTDLQYIPSHRPRRLAFRRRSHEAMLRCGVRLSSTSSDSKKPGRSHVLTVWSQEKDSLGTTPSRFPSLKSCRTGRQMLQYCRRIHTSDSTCGGVSEGQPFGFLVAGNTGGCRPGGRTDAAE